MPWRTGVIKNEATAARRRLYFHLVDAADGYTPETGEAGGQPQISSDGAAWTNTGIGVLVAVGNGTYYADVTQATVNDDHLLVMGRFKSAATREAFSLNVLEVGGEVAHFGAPGKNKVKVMKAGATAGKQTVYDSDGSTELFHRTPTPDDGNDCVNYVPS